MRAAVIAAALVTVAVCYVAAQGYGPQPPHRGRDAIIQEAIVEEKQLAMEREDARRAQAQTASTGSGRISPRHYKHITKEARRQGDARELLEGMVRRAERKLMEEQRESHAQVQSAEVRAEELATELFHRPGSLLTNDEVALLMEESGCRETEEFEEILDCYTPTFTRYRKIDGTCNNLRNPFLGAANTALVRLIPAQYEDGVGSLRGDIQNKRGSIFNTTAFQPPNPSPRHISQSVVRNVTDNELLTHILMQWGQFIDHDLSLSPENEDECAERAEHCEFTDVCRPIRVTDRDPVFGLGTSNNGACIAFSRSLAACGDPTLPIVADFTPREQINVLTSFIDGSMIYGSDVELENKLREFSDGLLREGTSLPGKKAELPRITIAENNREEEGVFVGCPNEGTHGGCFLAGDLRVNEQSGLTIMHTLWVREHNRIARELATLNPSWDDERLYQEARKIVGAIIQKITYYDYLPLILGRDVFDIVLDDHVEYDPRINPGVTNSFATAAYRYGHTLIRPFFDRLNSDYDPMASGPINLLEMFFNPDSYRNSLGTDPILRGMVTQNSRRVDEFMNSVLTDNLFGAHLDLASLNIQRGRDHGLPPYLTWQRYCQRLFPKLEVTDFTNTLTLLRFLEVYGSLDTVDLWIGGLAEDRLPGSLLGPTFACLFGITFANIRDGDRFYFRAEGVFTSDQVDSILQHSLSKVICDNGDDIVEIQRDAFSSGQTREMCSGIPGIDLSLWQEDRQMCYYHLEIQPRNIPLSIRSFSRTLGVPIVPFVDELPGGVDSVCVPVVCPERGEKTAVAFYIESNGPMGRSLELQPNQRIPRSMVDSDEDLLYQGELRSQLFEQPNSGLFKDKMSCEESNVAAFTIDATNGGNSRTRSSRDALFVQQTNRRRGNTDSPLSPETDERIPEPLRDFFMIDYSTEGRDGGSDEEEEDEEEVSMPEAQLIADLEEALRDLDL